MTSWSVLARAALAQVRADVAKGRVGKPGGHLNQRIQADLDQIEAALQAQQQEIAAARVMQNLTDASRLFAGVCLSPREREEALKAVATFRRLYARQSHPDVGGDPQQMAQVNKVADYLESVVLGVRANGGV